MLALVPAFVLALCAAAANQKAVLPNAHLLATPAIAPLTAQTIAIPAVNEGAPAGALPQASQAALPGAAFAAKTFDGSKLPAYLASADPVHAPWLSRLVETAQKSKTARRVLRDAEKMSLRTGRPVLVAVGEPRDWAAFDFDTQILWMPKSALRKSARNGATALAHELRHAVQLGSGLPDMFELELDAYMFDFQVASELGDEAKRGTYDASARAAFRRGPDDFVRYLRKYYKADVARHGRGKEYRAELAEGLAYNRGAHARAAALLARRMVVLDAMEARNYPPAAVQAYREESIVPVQRRLAAIDRAIGWAERDLALDADPKARKRTAAFARRAVERLNRLSGALDVP